MIGDQTIEQPYNGYSRLEDEDGNPISTWDGKAERDSATLDRDIALRQILISAEILLHLRAITGERFTEQEINEVMP